MTSSAGAAPPQTAQFASRLGLTHEANGLVHLVLKSSSANHSSEATKIAIGLATLIQRSVDERGTRNLSGKPDKNHL